MKAFLYQANASLSTWIHSIAFPHKNAIKAPYPRNHEVCVRSSRSSFTRHFHPLAHARSHPRRSHPPGNGPPSSLLLSSSNHQNPTTKLNPFILSKPVQQLNANDLQNGLLRATASLHILNTSSIEMLGIEYPISLTYDPPLQIWDNYIAHPSNIMDHFDASDLSSDILFLERLGEELVHLQPYYEFRPNSCPWMPCIAPRLYLGPSYAKTNDKFYAVKQKQVKVGKSHRRIDQLTGFTDQAFYKAWNFHPKLTQVLLAQGAKGGPRAFATKHAYEQAFTKAFFPFNTEYALDELPQHKSQLLHPYVEILELFQKKFNALKFYECGKDFSDVYPVFWVGKGQSDSMIGMMTVVSKY